MQDERHDGNYGEPGYQRGENGEHDSRLRLEAEIGGPGTESETPGGRSRAQES